MRLPPVGWAFFGLIVVVLIFYLLNRGVYFGYDIERKLLRDGSAFFHKQCRYLHLSGIDRKYAGGKDDYIEAASLFCPPLKISD
jgi:hypothetical protein